MFAYSAVVSVLALAVYFAACMTCVARIATNHGRHTLESRPEATTGVFHDEVRMVFPDLPHVRFIGGNGGSATLFEHSFREALRGVTFRHVAVVPLHDSCAPCGLRGTRRHNSCYPPV